MKPLAMDHNEDASQRHDLGPSVPELGHGTGSIRIPELRNVVITRRVQDLVDHPAFQRLRRIRQLGPTHLVYPGAVHTRFEHSLGVYDCVRWYLQTLLRRPAFRDAAGEEDLLSVLAAGLLHDLGHYPFAHSLEALHLKGRDAPRHEEVGSRIIRGEFDSLRGPRTVAEILRGDWGVDPERVIALGSGTFPDGAPTQMDRILRSILSSAVDADKMDYLERDSHHMGVPYGRHYDRGRLLASLTVDEPGASIAVMSKGKVPAEMFIFARYTMFSEAYWHHTVRAASAMVEAALAAFQSRWDGGIEELLPVLLSHDDDALLRWLHDQTPASSGTRYLLDGLVGHQRRLYKRVVTLSRVYQEEDKRRAYERIYGMEAARLYDLSDRIRARLSSLVGRSLHPADLIIDTPPRDKDRLETITIVYPDASGQGRYPLHALSRIVAGVQDDFMMVVKKIRIFAEPTLAQELGRHDQVDRAILDEILR